jgi:hypothetical protein
VALSEFRKVPDRDPPRVREDVKTLIANFAPEPYAPVLTLIKGMLPKVRFDPIAAIAARGKSSRISWTTAKHVEYL